MTPPGGRHSSFGTCSRVSSDFLPPRQQWARNPPRPGTTQAEAYAGDKRLRAKCHTAGAGSLRCTLGAQPCAQVCQITVRGGAAQRPHPVGQVLHAVQYRDLRRSQCEASMRRRSPLVHEAATLAMCSRTEDAAALHLRKRISDDFSFDDVGCDAAN